MSKSVTRLFQQFQPSSYDLTLDLDSENMQFRGTVVIAGKKTGRPSQRLSFHAKDLQITAASITVRDKKGERDAPVSRINLQQSFHEVRLHTDEMLYPGEYSVRIDFEAPITTGMTGLYPCFFKHGEVDKALLATQFESHHAREVFPCIDEPEAKATFDLTLHTETGVTTLGNTPIKEQKTEDDRLITRFETTPKMSSYLLAFVVGEIHCKSAKTNQGTEVNVWATVAQPIDSLDFGLDVSVRSIEFFEDYFGVPYPLPKADHIALPDFSSGAMENWGLITYRERVLLAYPGEASQSVRETIALVVAHETSHQWFGNLVTMKWWNDLWLNESFANMMEYQAVDSMFPEWQIWDSFIAAEGLSALRRDATPGVQSVRVDVNHPDEISTLFDPSIVYAKGGRLLFMLKNYIGDEVFRKGLSSYFKRFAYQNTEGSDLWDELGKAAGIDIAAFMNPWLQESGFPVVTVARSEKGTSVRQEHFSDNPAKADSERLWPVPLFASLQDTPNILTSRELTIARQQSSNGPLRINSGARGHYIVSYTDQSDRNALAEMVADGRLDNAERLMLLNDTSMLARAGHHPYGEALKLLAAYENESNETVWDIMSLIIGESRRFIDNDESLEDMIKTFIRGLVAKQFSRLDWEEKLGESAADQKLRALIISLGSYADITDIL